MKTLMSIRSHIGRWPKCVFVFVCTEWKEGEKERMKERERKGMTKYIVPIRNANWFEFVKRVELTKNWTEEARLLPLRVSSVCKLVWVCVSASELENGEPMTAKATIEMKQEAGWYSRRRMACPKLPKSYLFQSMVYVQVNVCVCMCVRLGKLEEE